MFFSCLTPSSSLKQAGHHMKRWKYKLEGGGRAGWGRMAYRAGDGRKGNSPFSLSNRRKGSQLRHMKISCIYAV